MALFWCFTILTKLKLKVAMRKIYLMSLLLAMSILSTTTKISAQVILTEGFEGGTFPPSGWLNVHTTGTNTAAIWETATTGAVLGDDVLGNPVSINPRTGTGMAQFRSYDFSAGNGANLITSSFSLTAFAPHRVKFWMYRDPGYNGNQDSISVYINTTASATGANFLGKIIRGTGQSPTVAAAGWYEYSFNIPVSFNTSTNHIIFSAASRFGNNMFIDDVTVENNPLCTGTPVGGTANASATFLCATGNTTLTVPGASSGGGITYQWQSSPAGANTYTNIATATTASYVAAVAASTDYRCVVTCSNGGASANSAPVTVTLSGVPANDLICDATTLVLNGPEVCGNTTCATATGETAPSCSGSTANNIVWFKFTPTVTAPYRMVMNRPAGASAAQSVDAWIGIYTTATPCPTPGVLTEVTQPSCLRLDIVSSTTDTIVTGPLTAGTTYYIQIDGVNGSFGAYCLKLSDAPVPPACVTNISPANAATGVAVAPNTPLSWNASPGATNYSVFFGTANPPTTNVGTVAGTNSFITNLAFSTTYYWYVVPNNGVDAVGCASNTTSFTTVAAPPPPVNDACSGALELTVGAGVCTAPLLGDLIVCDSTTGLALPICQTNIYLKKDIWYKAVVPASGKLVVQTSAVNTSTTDMAMQAYTGSCGSLTPIPGTLSTPSGANIGCDDDGNTDPTPSSFHSRVVIDSVLLAGQTVYFRIMPYSTAANAGQFAICAVENIPLNLAAGTPNTCITSTAVNMDSARKYATTPFVNAANEIVGVIYPNGQKLGNTTFSLYQNATPTVRQAASGEYYLDRNFNVTVQTQPDLAVAGRPNVTFFYTATDSARFAVATGQPTIASGLNITKNNDACSGVYSGSGSYLGSVLGSGAAVPGLIYFIQDTVSTFSSFYIHRSGTALPISLQSFTGRKIDKTNMLEWTTAAESNNSGFELQRSANGISFSTIGFVASKAPNGNSSAVLNYSFPDVTPMAGTNFYRLKQIDKDGRFSLSKVVAIKGLKPTAIQVVSVYPNPTTSKLSVNIESPVSDRISFLVTDVTGKVVMNKAYSIAVGDNLVDLNVSNLPAGSYFIKAVCTNGCETITTKFVKQ
jgi:hypothetical protein